MDDERTGEVLSHFAHDLINPLTAARVLIDLLQDDAPPSMLRDLTDLAASVELCCAMTEGLSDFGRVIADSEPTYDARPTALASIIESAAARVTPGLVIPVTPTLVRADRAAAVRALGLVLLNARRMAEISDLQLRIEGSDIVLLHRGVHPSEADLDDLLDTDGVCELRARRVRSGALGLAPAARLAEWLGGSLEVETTSAGLIVRLRLMPFQ